MIPPVSQADTAPPAGVSQEGGTNSLRVRYGGMERHFARIATSISTVAGKPLTFLLAVAIIVVWAITGPIFHFSDTWQLIINTGTTIVTFLMVFLIQNAQNRDAAAIQAKLDELLRAVGQARNRFIGVEHLTEREIEMIRRALEREAKDPDQNPGSAKSTVDRLLDRF